MAAFYDFVKSEKAWLEFLGYEEAKEFLDERLIRKINYIISEKKYKDFDDHFMNNFAIPRYKEIHKYNTSKFRIVYVYPSYHKLVLKLTSYYILKRYNKKFSKNSIAYTKGRSVKTAFSLIKRYRIKKTDTVYKSDFSDYFNSIDIGILGGKLKSFLNKDLELCEFIMRLITNPYITKYNKIVKDEHKGVMAGSPIAGILANIYMHDIDELMHKKKYKYIRYADDTLIVGEEALNFFKEQIKELKIALNPKKTEVMNIKTGISFLGFYYLKNKIDLSEKAKAKMKSRFKRRAKWYSQWMLRKNVKREVAIKDYIKKLNHKLYSDQDDSVNWSRWYLPNINTTESIKYLDEYFVACIRYLDSGMWARGKKFYRLSYEDIKKLGFRSLVNEYWKIKKGKKIV